jgi:hypothetical protein
VTLYQGLLETNTSTDETSYHLTGSVDMDGNPAAPLDEWASANDTGSAPIELALLAGARFQRFYANDARQGAVRGIDLHVDAIPNRVSVELETARLVSPDIVHPGDTVTVEATIRPWRKPAINMRIPVTIPARLNAGSLRILVSDSGTLDRALDQPRPPGRAVDIDSIVARAKVKHAADRIYVSLLLPETQAEMNGQTLSGLPLSVANVLEPLRTAQDVNLNGESAQVAGEAPAGGVLTGFQVLNLRIEPGGSLD